MFGVFQSVSASASEGGEGVGALLEKRVFCFAGSDDCGNGTKEEGGGRGDVMEVRVFRAKGRKRIRPEVEPLLKPGTKGSSPKKGSPKKLVRKTCVGGIE